MNSGVTRANLKSSGKRHWEMQSLNSRHKKGTIESAHALSTLTGIPVIPGEDSSSRLCRYFLIISVVVFLKLNVPCVELPRISSLFAKKFLLTNLVASRIDILVGLLRLVKNSLNLAAIRDGSSIVALSIVIDFGALLEVSLFFNLIEVE